LQVLSQGEHLTRFMVKPKSFELALGLVEPLFFRMAVYDVANSSKVSEDVFFELNTPLVKNMVPTLARQGDEEEREKNFVCVLIFFLFLPFLLLVEEPHPVFSHLQFVFQVVPSSSLHLVVVVSKIPDFDSDSTAIYSQGSSD